MSGEVLTAVFAFAELWNQEPLARTYSNVRILLIGVLGSTLQDRPEDENKGTRIFRHFLLKVSLALEFFKNRHLFFGNEVRKEALFWLNFRYFL